MLQDPTWRRQFVGAKANDVMELMVGGDQPVAAYKTFRDSTIFTTKRMIVRDAQGITGKKVEIYSLPYSAISMWSSYSSAAAR